MSIPADTVYHQNDAYRVPQHVKILNTGSIISFEQRKIEWERHRPTRLDIIRTVIPPLNSALALRKMELWSSRTEHDGYKIN